MAKGKGKRRRAAKGKKRKATQVERRGKLTAQAKEKAESKKARSQVAKAALERRAGVVKGSGGKSKAQRSKEAARKKVEIPVRNSGVPEKYLAGLSPAQRAKREREIVRRSRESHKDPKAYRPFKTDVDPKTGKPHRTKESQYTRRYREIYGIDAMGSVSKVAKATGLPRSIIKTVYDRGLAAWHTGHRPGATGTAWGLARIYSFAVGGKTWRTADKDQAEKAKALGFRPGKRVKNPSRMESRLLEQRDRCRDAADLLAAEVDMFLRGASDEDGLRRAIKNYVKVEKWGGPALSWARRGKHGAREWPARSPAGVGLSDAGGWTEGGPIGRPKKNPSGQQRLKDALVALCHPDAYKLLGPMIKPKPNSWTRGGCCVFAMALQEHLGRGELKMIERNGKVVHVVLKLGRKYVDGDGVHTKTELMSDWSDRPILTRAQELPLRKEGTRLLDLDVKAARKSGVRCPSPTKIVRYLERYAAEKKAMRSRVSSSMKVYEEHGAVRGSKPTARSLIKGCRDAWTYYCDRPNKTRLRAVFKHLDAMKGSEAKTVKEERRKCLRAANAEAKRLGIER